MIWLEVGSSVSYLGVGKEARRGAHRGWTSRAVWGTLALDTVWDETRMGRFQIHFDLPLHVPWQCTPETRVLDTCDRPH